MADSFATAPEAPLDSPLDPVGGQGDKKAIAGRCNELRAQIKETTSEYDRGAGILLLTEATMTEVPEPKEHHAMPVEPGMG